MIELRRILIVVLTCASAWSHAAADDQLVYVKKDSRRATRDASLLASGQAKPSSDWFLIG
ncbi:MAG: hypothetical protein JNG90_10130, partial [Planctomycetaceae bacterium]|nr:hypothetical protein [Planctomycetaceae bacterium]